MLESRHTRYGIVLGRMQPLHLGHIEYLDAARSHCGRLVIGVTNPDVNDLVDDAADLSRSRPENNPFSYFDRQEMIASSMVEHGWTSEDFTVVPADVNRPHSLSTYLPAPAISTVFVTVYDEWGDRKSDLLSGLGYKVEVLWRRTMDERLTSGSALRQAMRTGSSWQHLVPVGVARYLEDTGLRASLTRADQTGADEL